MTGEKLLQLAEAALVPSKNIFGRLEELAATFGASYVVDGQAVVIGLDDLRFHYRSNQVQIYGSWELSEAPPEDWTRVHKTVNDYGVNGPCHSRYLSLGKTICVTGEKGYDELLNLYKIMGN